MLLASAVDLTSSGFLGFILGGGLLTAILGAYRFTVNFRQTERGMARDRVDQAVRDQRAERTARQRAEREATLWQNRCGDLEYALRQAGVPVPAIDAELHVLAFSSNAESIELNNESSPRSPRGVPLRRSRPLYPQRDETTTELENRLRRQEDDESRRANHHLGSDLRNDPPIGPEAER